MMDLDPYTTRFLLGSLLILAGVGGALLSAWDAER